MPVFYKKDFPDIKKWDVIQTHETLMGYSPGKFICNEIGAGVLLFHEVPMQTPVTYPNNLNQYDGRF